MELESILNMAINSSFAIVMCILMFKRMNEQDDKLTSIVINNTEATTKLCEKIDRLLDQR